MEKVRSVIFDWGGVLIEDPGPPMMRYCAGVLGVAEAGFAEAVRKFASDFRKGLVEERVFWERVCGELGAAVPKDGSLWGAAFRAVYQPMEQMWRLVENVRAGGIATALLSNTEAPAAEFFNEQGYNCFDAVVFSCMEGTKKPERQIYELTLERLGCQAGEAFFIDDHPLCVEGAAAVGLRAVLFENIGQVKAELARVGIRAD